LKTSKPKLYGSKDLAIRHGPMTLGMFIRAFREADRISQVAFANTLKLSRANLCDLEKGRKLPSLERAAKIAGRLKVPPEVLVQLAIQDQLRQARLPYKVQIYESR